MSTRFGSRLEPGPESPNDDLHRGKRVRGSRAATFALVLLGVLSALFLVQPLVELPHKISRDYNEGWNALQVERLVHGEHLYPAYDALIGNNYPPLSFYVVAPLGALLEDDLIAGRVVALLGLLLGAAAAGLIVFCACRRWYGAIAASATLIAFMGARYGGYVAIDDPQWLGHGLMLLGTMCLLCGKRSGNLWAPGALLMVAGGFVKHTLIPLPLAATIWVVFERREWLWRWLICVGLFLAVGFGVASYAHGLDFLRQLFVDARAYKVTALITGIDQWFTPLLPLLVLTGLAVPILRRSEQGRFILNYTVLSIGWGAFLLGGAGVDGNAVFDVLIACSLGVGIVSGADFSEEIYRQRKIAFERSLVMFCVIAALVPAVPRYLYDLRIREQNLRGIEAQTRAEVRYIAASRGPVACENLALCYWAGKGFELDFFLTGQKLARGVIDKSRVASLLGSHYYSLIELENADGSVPRLPKELRAILYENYQIIRAHTAFGAILAPKPDSGRFRRISEKASATPASL